MKKIIATCLALFLMVAVFAVPVSAAATGDAANEREVVDNDSVPGYMCRSLTQYSENTSSVFATATFRRDISGTTAHCKVITFAAIEYTDGDYTTGEDEVEDDLTSYPDAIMTMLDVYEDTTKWPEKLYSEHHFYVDGECVHTEVLDFVPGAFAY